MFFMKIAVSYGWSINFNTERASTNLRHGYECSITCLSVNTILRSSPWCLLIVTVYIHYCRLGRCSMSAHTFFLLQLGWCLPIMAACFFTEELAIYNGRQRWLFSNLQSWLLCSFYLMLLNGLGQISTQGCFGLTMSWVACCSSCRSFWPISRVILNFTR